MMLTFTLSNTEYVAVMKALRKASQGWGLTTRVVVSEAERLELEHLRTLLAEASINTNRRCSACDQTAERCIDWGGDCCPLCTHQTASA